MVSEQIQQCLWGTQPMICPFFYQPDWCVYLHFPMPTLLWCYYCPFLSPGTAFFCPCFFFVHACSLYLLWGLLLGRYLKGMTFKLNPSDYTKTEYGFWANPTMPWGTHPMICHFSFINLTDVVTFSLFNANIIIVFGLPFPVSWHSFLQYPFLDLICTLCLPWGLLLGWYLKGLAFKCIPPLIIPILNMVSEQNCLYYNFSSVSFYRSYLYFMFAVRTPARMVSEGVSF